MKYEDSKTVLELLEEGFYVFSFDLKSAYHHIDLFEERRIYFTFKWEFEDGTTEFFQVSCISFWPHIGPLCVYQGDETNCKVLAKTVHTCSGVSR